MVKKNKKRVDPTAPSREKLSSLPPRTPQSLEEAVLFGALSELNEDVVADYVRGIYDRGRGTKKQREASMRAILKVATVGFAFYNWYVRRDGQEQGRDAR